MQKIFPPYPKFITGFRGIAAIIVFTHHYAMPFYPSIWNGYNYTEADRHLLQLPIIRLLYSGTPMVALFFVISGYSLSWKPLKCLHTHQPGEFVVTIARSIWKRPIRLIIPPVISSFILMVLFRLNIYHIGLNENDIFGILERGPVMRQTWIAQLYDFWKFLFYRLTNFWTVEFLPHGYDVHLWYIPIEFRGSMITLSCLVVLSHMNSRFRIMVWVFLCVYCLSWLQWDVACFFGGAGLMQSTIRKSSWNPPFGIKCIKNSNVEKLIWGLVLLLGLYLMSYPEVDGFEGTGHNTPGYISLSFIFDVAGCWHTLGALSVIYASANMSPVRQFLSSSILQRLGDLSFSLYLVHGPFLHTFGYGLVPLIWKVSGKDTTFRFNAGFILGYLVALFVTIHVAIIFQSFVEAPCLEACKYIESILEPLPENIHDLKKDMQ